MRALSVTALVPVPLLCLQRLSLDWFVVTNEVGEGNWGLL